MKNAFEYDDKLAALREELEHSECMRENYKIDAKVYKDALTAAEQRNAELTEELTVKTEAFEMIGDEYGKLYRSFQLTNDLLSRAYGAIDDFALAEEIKAALKPTESGASEFIEGSGKRHMSGATGHWYTDGVKDE